MRDYLIEQLAVDERVADESTSGLLDLEDLWALGVGNHRELRDEPGRR